MTITLNHTNVPARDKAAAAKFFADIFGLKRGPAGHFAPVRINKNLTLLFDDGDAFESHHLAFHVSDREFDAIFDRIRKAKIAFGSAPWSLDDGKLNDWGGRARPLFLQSRRPCAGNHDRPAVTAGTLGQRFVGANLSNLPIRASLKSSMHSTVLEIEYLQCFPSVSAAEGTRTVSDTCVNCIGGCSLV
jgi:hypothetical protein